MAAIVTIIDWVRDILQGLTPESRPGDTFRESLGTEPLDRMPIDDLFHRSFRVINARDGELENTFPSLELKRSLTIQIAYLGQQDDDRIEQWMDEDEELIMRNLMQPSPTPAFPVELCNIDFLGASEPIDLSAGGRNVLILPIVYEFHYTLAAAA